jgi:hypothetical protein
MLVLQRPAVEEADAPLRAARVDARDTTGVAMTTDTWAPEIPGVRPAMLADDAELYDMWLAPNGVVGLIPECTTVVVADGHITYSAWRHENAGSGPWDSSDVMIASDLWTAEERIARRDDPAGMVALVDERTVPLVVPVTDRVRELFAASVLTLIER